LMSVLGLNYLRSVLCLAPHLQHLKARRGRLAPQRMFLFNERHLLLFVVLLQRLSLAHCSEFTASRHSTIISYSLDSCHWYYKTDETYLWQCNQVELTGGICIDNKAWEALDCDESEDDGSSLLCS
jgi:hypothetical protein